MSFKKQHQYILTHFTFCHYRESSSISESVDFKRQLEMVEQEATILRNKVLSLEQETEKLSNENKKLALHAAKLTKKDSLTNSAENQKSLELVKVKDSLSKAEEEKAKLEEKLKNILEIPVEKLPARVPKKYSDTNTKYQLQV